MVTWLAALMAICLSSVWAAAMSNVGHPQGRKDDVRDQLRDAAFRSASKTATIGFKASLEMKESVDFLITPALLVQQTMTEDVIPTYPAE